MANVYDIIIRIRDGHNLTTRHLAMMAGIPPTTLESLLQRKAQSLRKDWLVRIARVFGMPWHALMTTSDDEQQVPLCKNDKFVPVYAIDDDEAERIVQHFLALPTPVLGHKRGITPSHVNTRAHEIPMSADEHFRQSILVVLNRLNSDGLMEAMRRVLDVQNNPVYCLREEDKPCDSKERP